MAHIKAEKIEAAVISHQGMTQQALLERAFAFAFRGLVYAQIWEDPAVDMEALAIQDNSHVVTIASGGCNVMSYLTANPRRITAVDLNTAHVALNRLKLKAVQSLPDYAHFRRFFGDADTGANIAAYDQHIAPHLDADARKYWEGRDALGRRRIGMFARGAYKSGLLGKFIFIAHSVARLHGINPRDIFAARTIEEQRQIFAAKFAPLFDKPFVRWLTGQPASLFGLGIPPAQYSALSGGRPMAQVLSERLEKLACGFDLKDNYYAWQAFGRGYGKAADAPLPPYLQSENFQTVAQRADRVDILHANMTEWLSSQNARSIDRYVLLDAQDWMTDAQLSALWSEITRTSNAGARVLFRTADEPSLLPGRLPDSLLNEWHYCEEDSHGFTQRDRSAIYGGVHLYIRKG